MFKYFILLFKIINVFEFKLNLQHNNNNNNNHVLRYLTASIRINFKYGKMISYNFIY